MANRFWVLGTGNTSDTAHWSATTGGAGGETVPVAGDSVTFDSNSGTAATVTVDVALSAASITINKSDLTLIHNAGTTLTGAVTLTAGTLNTNGQACQWGSFSSSNSNARTLTMGASAITLTTTQTAFLVTVSSFTITANTATVTLTGTTATFASGSNNFNGMSLVMSGAGAQVISPSSGGATTFANFTRTGTATKTDGLTVIGSFIVTGTCTLGGNSTQGVNRLLVQSNTVGTQRTITAAAYVITGDVDFMDINLAYSGGASWTNAGSAFIGDALGNTGAVTTNATVSATQTATGTASFTWSTHGWTSRVPLPQDDVSIPNAFVAGQTISMDMPRLGRTLTFTCTGSPNWSVSINGEGIYGGLTLAAGMTTTSGSTNQIVFRGRGSYSLTSNGVTFSNYFDLKAPGGTLTLTDNFVQATNRDGYIDNGALVAVAGVTWGAFTVLNSSGNTLTMGSGTWTLAGTGTVFSIGTSTTLSAATTTIVISDTSATAKTFAGGGKTYGTLRHTATGSAALTITGNNTFTALDLECTTARTITFPAGGTQTITGTLTLLGAAGQLLSLRSSSTGTKWYINAATTSAQYCDVKDSTATGTGTPIDNSTGGVDSGNNIGWLFSAGGSAGYSSTLLTLGVG